MAVIHENRIKFLGIQSPRFYCLCTFSRSNVRMCSTKMSKYSKKEESMRSRDKETQPRRDGQEFLRWRWREILLQLECNQCGLEQDSRGIQDERSLEEVRGMGSLHQAKACNRWPLGILPAYGASVMLISALLMLESKESFLTVNGLYILIFLR